MHMINVIRDAVIMDMRMTMAMRHVVGNVGRRCAIGQRPAGRPVAVGGNGSR